MGQVVNLLPGSWTGQPTPLIMALIIGMIGYFIYPFTRKDQAPHFK